jgi:hypothetical protein
MHLVGFLREDGYSHSLCHQSKLVDGCNKSREYLRDHMLNVVYQLVDCSGDGLRSSPPRHFFGDFLLRINTNKHQVSHTEVGVSGLRSHTFLLFVTLGRDALPDLLMHLLKSSLQIFACEVVSSRVASLVFVEWEY